MDVLGPADEADDANDALAELARQVQAAEAEADKPGPNGAPRPERPRPEPLPRTPEDARRKAKRAVMLLVNASRALDAASKVVEDSTEHTKSSINAAFEKAYSALAAAAAHVRQAGQSVDATARQVHESAKAMADSVARYEETMGRNLPRLNVLLTFVLVCAGLGALCAFAALLAIILS